MNIWIVGDAFGFPHGYGASARVHAYAKGLRENGVSVRVLCLKTSERSDEDIANTQAKGSYEGIPFEYTCGQTVRPNSFWRRRWLEIKGAIGFWRALRSTVARDPVDAIILFSNSASWILLVIMLSRLARAKCIQEKSEFPFVYSANSSWLRLYAAVYTRLIYRLFDGMIVISTYLERYFSDRVRRGARILRVPILVDVAQFELVACSSLHSKRRLVYVGNLDHESEVSSLIGSFGIIAPEHTQWQLQIIGSTSNLMALDELKRQVMQLGLNGRVEFTGAVPRNDLPRYLCAADVLALPRASGLFSQAGFPTKLGEYLATGKPVVATSTGDIPLYLQDNFSAFLSPPDDMATFAQKLHYVMSHPAEAAAVGQCGKKIALEYFDCRTNCHRILDYVATLQEPNGHAANCAI